VECKLRCVNLRRVSDRRRAFWPAFRGTAITDDWSRSTMGVIVIGFGTPRSTGQNIECTLQHLGAPATIVGAPTSNLRVPMTSLRAPRITVEQGNKNNVFFGNAASAPGNHSYYL